MNSYRIIEGNTCKSRLRPERLTPRGLEKMIINLREGLSPQLIRAIPLGREYQQTLLEYSHYLSQGAREALLFRLSGHSVFYPPLFYELCDRAGRAARLKAWHISKGAANLNALAMLEEAMGWDMPQEHKSTFKQLAQKLMGLAY